MVDQAQFVVLIKTCFNFSKKVFLNRLTQSLLVQTSPNSVLVAVSIAISATQGGLSDWCTQSHY